MEERSLCSVFKILEEVVSVLFVFKELIHKSFGIVPIDIFSDIVCLPELFLLFFRFKHRNFF